MALDNETDPEGSASKPLYRDMFTGVSRERLSRDLTSDRERLRELYEEALSGGGTTPADIRSLPLHTKAGRLLHALTRRLNPTRRILFVFALGSIGVHIAMSLLSLTGVFIHNLSLPFATAILVVLLMLELLEKTDVLKELSLARKIQLSLFPSTTVSRGDLEIESFAMTAQEVGGDYLDVIRSKDGTYVIVADVAGKGLGAALYMVRLQALVRLLTSKGTPSPRKLLAELNDFIKSDRQDRTFVTALVAFFPVDRQEVVMARAGHHPALIYRRQEDQVQEAKMPGIALGMSSSRTLSKSLRDTVLPFEEGDSLLLFTDGLVESRNPSGEEFGVERVEATMSVYGSLRASSIMHQITTSLDRHLQDHVPLDDVTVTCVKRSARIDADARGTGSAGVGSAAGADRKIQIEERVEQETTRGT